MADSWLLQLMMVMAAALKSASLLVHAGCDCCLWRTEAVVEIVCVVQKAQHPAETFSVVAESLFVGIAIAGRVRTLSQLHQANIGGLHALHTLLSG